MKPSMPPATATWLLKRFGSGSEIEFLMGDLMEGYAHGRSVGWYWRQVVAAIVIGFAHELRAHKLLALRLAVALTSIAVSTIFGVQTWDPMMLAIVTLLLCVVSLFAAYVPSVRASQVDPVEALRLEA